MSKKLANRLLAQVSKSTKDSEAIGKTSSQLLASLQKDNERFAKAMSKAASHSNGGGGKIIFPMKTNIINRPILHQHFFEHATQTDMLLQ